VHHMVGRQDDSEGWWVLVGAHYCKWQPHPERGQYARPNPTSSVPIRKKVIVCEALPCLLPCPSACSAGCTVRAQVHARPMHARPCRVILIRPLLRVEQHAPHAARTVCTCVQVHICVCVCTCVQVHTHTHTDEYTHRSCPHVCERLTPLCPRPG